MLTICPIFLPIFLFLQRVSFSSPRFFSFQIDRIAVWRFFSLIFLYWYFCLSILVVSYVNFCLCSDITTCAYSSYELLASSLLGMIWMLIRFGRKGIVLKMKTDFFFLKQKMILDELDLFTINMIIIFYFFVLLVYTAPLWCVFK